MNRTITLLHLSDLHARADTAWDAERVTREFVADLRRLANDDGLRPDLVLFTGDLAWDGTTADFERGWTVLRAIQRAYRPSLTNDALFLVPGNHDVDRNEVGALARRWQANTNRDEVEETIRAGGKDWRDLTTRLDAYRAFLDRHALTHLQTHASRAIWHARRNVRGCTIGLAGFNTAWSCGQDGERGKLWMGARWQHATLSAGVRDAEVRIALLHHPTSWLHEHEEPDLDRALVNDFHLTLHGHEHRHRVTPTQDGHATLAAGACYQGSQQPNGYSVIELDRAAKEVRVHLRAYDAAGGGWVARPVARRAPKGVWTFTAPWLPDPAAVDAPSSPAAPPSSPLPADVEDHLVTYGNRLAARCTDLPIAGFKTKVRMPLQLEDVYVQLRARPRSGSTARDSEKAGGRRDYARLEEREIAFDDVLSTALAWDRNGVVVLGEPGSGKTTLLKHFVLAAAEAPTRFGLPTDVVPVLIELRRLKRPTDGLQSAMVETFAAVDGLDAADAQALARALLRQSARLFVLLDGLDEVADKATRASVSRWLENAFRDHRAARFVLTSRHAGYVGDAVLHGRLLEVDVLPLTSDDARSFIARWYTAVEKQAGAGRLDGPADPAEAAQQAREQAEHLCAKLFDDDRPRTRTLRDLIENPLMLQILCLVHRDRRHLPERRVELYAECLEVLIALWREAKQMPVDLPLHAALAVLQPLAWHFHTEEIREASRETIEPVIRGPLRAQTALKLQPSGFLDAVRDQTGVLVSLGSGDFAFLHLSFQEYLAARHVQNRFAEDDAVLESLVDHFGEPWWREVTLLTVGLTNPSLFGPLMRRLIAAGKLSTNPSMASYCVLDATSPSAVPLLQALADGVEDAGERYQVVRLLKSAALEGWAEVVVADGRTGREVLEGLRVDESDDEVRGLLQELLGIEAPAIVSGVGEPEAGAEQVHEKDGSVLVYVPGGSYTLGAEVHYDEKPIHTVTLSPYWIGKYPVTNAQYGTFLEATKHDQPEYWGNKQFNGSDQPVVGVTWHDAQAYCAWAGLVLPSEAQWEAAARGTDQRAYPWGDAEPTETLANFGQNVGRTTPVGSYPDGAGPFGALDQAGNVWEWCVDVWSVEAYKNRDGKEDPVNEEGDETVRALRGGSWVHDPGWLRGAYRNGDWVTDRYWSLGFRVCVPAPRAR
ncbi:MAG: SUMF1/EgtB/PvdO family nonheme iron enzyme, partial [Acidobacteriota bacterium]